MEFTTFAIGANLNLLYICHSGKHKYVTKKVVCYCYLFQNFLKLPLELSRTVKNSLEHFAFIKNIQELSIEHS